MRGVLYLLYNSKAMKIISLPNCISLKLCCVNRNLVVRREKLLRFRLSCHRHAIGCENRRDEKRPELVHKGIDDTIIFKWLPAKS